MTAALFIVTTILSENDTKSNNNIDVFPEDKKQVVVSISNILRLEEERYLPTEPLLRDILIVLEAGYTPEELESLFAGIKS